MILAPRALRSRGWGGGGWGGGWGGAAPWRDGGPTLRIDSRQLSRQSALHCAVGWRWLPLGDETDHGSMIRAVGRQALRPGRLKLLLLPPHRWLTGPRRETVLLDRVGAGRHKLRWFTPRPARERVERLRWRRRRRRLGILRTQVPASSGGNYLSAAENDALDAPRALYERQRLEKHLSE